MCFDEASASLLLDEKEKHWGKSGCQAAISQRERCGAKRALTTVCNGKANCPGHMYLKIWISFPKNGIKLAMIIDVGDCWRTPMLRTYKGCEKMRETYKYDERDPELPGWTCNQIHRATHDHDPGTGYTSLQTATCNSNTIVMNLLSNWTRMKAEPMARSTHQLSSPHRLRKIVNNLESNSTRKHVTRIKKKISLS